MQQARFAYGKGALAGFTAVVLAVSLMVPATAFADPTSAEKRAEAEAVLASLNTMQEQLDRASNNYFTALSEQEEAEKSRDAAQERIDEANGQICLLYTSTTGLGSVRYALGVTPKVRLNARVNASCDENPWASAMSSRLVSLSRTSLRAKASLRCV